ncbi:MAG: YitT family protein [Bacteroidaceae bacterium]|nr:YitT family protein [Bacteroidaceae bacterium]MBP5322553.1 YitT family protein [Bacteroidaceae bacterium]
MKSIVNSLGVVKTWKFWKEMLIMTVGMFIAAAAIYYFQVPGKIVLGTVSGLAIFLSEVLSWSGIVLKVSTIIVILNAFLIVLALLLLGKDFGLKTVYTALIAGPLMDLWEWIKPYQELIEEGQTSVMGDPFLDVICFVIVLSASQAILFHINASSGGLDIIAKIINKYLHLDIGTSVAIVGIIICCTAFFINPFRLVIIGIIGTWINGLALDYFTAGLNKRKRVCIISEHHEEIRRYIIDKLYRGCSLYEVTGGYSGEKSVEIQALLTQNEFAELMSYMRENNMHAFITAGNVSEVYGLWRHSKRRKEKNHLNQNGTVKNE